MVSLNRNFSNNFGGRYFDDSSVRMDDGRQLLDPILSAENDNGFKPLRTVPAFSFHLLISSIISVTGIILAASWSDSKRCEAYFIMIYMRAIYWLITFLFDHLIKLHHEKLRMNGYHDFNRTTATHKSVPLQIVSLWNTYLLGIQALMQQMYGDDFGEKCAIVGLFSPIVYITLFSSLETIIFFFVHGTYISKVIKFNKSAPLPDALLGSRNISGSIGLNQRGADIADLLEKQADLISYLKDHNLQLNQKIMQMNAQVRTVSFPSNH